MQKVEKQSKNVFWGAESVGREDKGGWRRH